MARHLLAIIPTKRIKKRQNQLFFFFSLPFYKLSNLRTHSINFFLLCAVVASRPAVINKSFPDPELILRFGLSSFSFFAMLDLIAALSLSLMFSCSSSATSYANQTISHSCPNSGAQILAIK